MKKLFKFEFKELLDIVGKHIQKYWIMAIIFLSLLSLFAVGTSIAWYFSTDIVSKEKEITFYILQAFLVLISLVNIVFIVLNKKGKISNATLSILYHIYAFILMMWGTTVYIMDLTLGEPSIVFLMIATILSGLFVVGPLFFLLVSSLSVTGILIYFFAHPDKFFDGKLNWENVLNLIAFVFVIVLLAYRNYSITVREYKSHKRLEELTYMDELTGLYNERSYINEIESIDKRINDGEQVDFIIMMMDVNNLKVTNDTYGHRYGCSLVVRCGQLLPTIFTSSKAFHVGGDEFIVIATGEDYLHFEERLKEFDEKMLYTTHHYEGVDLIFSVARGYSKRKENEHYKNVLEAADKLMYENKKYLKEKYKMKVR